MWRCRRCELGADADEFIPAVVELLNGELAPYAVSYLTSPYSDSNSTDRNAIAISALTQALDSTDERFVANVAKCLGAMGTKGPHSSIDELGSAWQRVQSDAAKREILTAIQRLDPNSNLARRQMRESQRVALAQSVQRQAAEADSDA